VPADPHATVDTLTHREGDASSDRGLPRRLGDYEVLRELGRGGMGVVYQARQTKLNRLAALKMILAGSHAGPESLSRFRTEAQAIARLQHPNIVQIYEVGQCDGRPFIALELCAGGSLEARLRGTPLSPEDAAAVVEALARAMQAAHERGVLHRDLKPSNILLGSDGTPKVTDFGLAKLITTESGQTQTDAILGTPSYMAPEQAAGRARDLGPATDVYALGAILYETLTGRPPFKAPSVVGTLEQVRFMKPVPPRQLQPRLPRSLDTVCLKCLEKDPAHRYPTAAALAEDLRRYRENEPILARPPGLAVRFWLWCHRPERVRDAGSFLTFLGVVLTLWALSGILYLSLGVMHIRDARAGMAHLSTVIATVYLPLIVIGLGTLSRRGVRYWLWIGAVVSAALLLFCIMSIADLISAQRLVDPGGLHDEPTAGYPILTLLGMLAAVASFDYAVALLAHYSDRDGRR
jgi:tRNA A-37 threonylcarbamoyl transferase component Bud32